MSVTDRKRAAESRRLFPIVQINGWSVMEHPGLRYDEVRLDPAARCALVGEIRHVAYRADIDALKQAMRNDLRETMKDFAQRMGLHYPLDVR